MNLITAILIMTGEDHFLSDRMAEAAKRIKIEQLKDQPFLCAETVAALLKLKTAKIKLRDTRKDLGLR